MEIEKIEWPIQQSHDSTPKPTTMHKPNIETGAVLGVYSGSYVVGI